MLRLLILKVVNTAGALQEQYLPSVHKCAHGHVLTLVLTSDSILRHVGVDYWPRLEKQLPQQRLADLLIQAPHIHRCIWTE